MRITRASIFCVFFSSFLAAAMAAYHIGVWRSAIGSIARDEDVLAAYNHHGNQLKAGGQGTRR